MATLMTTHYQSKSGFGPVRLSRLSLSTLHPMVVSRTKFARDKVASLQAEDRRLGLQGTSWCSSKVRTQHAGSTTFDGLRFHNRFRWFLILAGPHEAREKRHTRGRWRQLDVLLEVLRHKVGRPMDEPLSPPYGYGMATVWLRYGYG